MKRVFWFHYNKSLSRKAGKPQITLHYHGKCHVIDNLIVNVPTWGYINKRQPYFVIKGRCKEVIFLSNQEVIIN